MTIRDGQARVHAREGVAYQIVVDGARIVQVKSRGDDAIPLAVKWCILDRDEMKSSRRFHMIVTGAIQAKALKTLGAAGLSVCHPNW